MDEFMVERWNSVVGKNDKVYHLGDVLLGGRSQMSILSRLNGKKILIKGNHDRFELNVYAKYFKDVRAYHKLDKFVLSHIPAHPNSVKYVNVHGHLHYQLVNKIGTQTPDPRYYSVCVELHNYTPVALDEIMQYYSKFDLNVFKEQYMRENNLLPK